jgi:hypothetical protein
MGFEPTTPTLADCDLASDGRRTKLRTRGRCTVTLPPWKPILPSVVPSGGRRGLRRGAPVSYCPSSRSICTMASNIIRALRDMDD